MNKISYKFKTIRLIARILSIISICCLSIFVIGACAHLVNFRIFDLIMFIFFPTGVVIGLLVSWFDELEGSLFSIISLSIFYLLQYIINGKPPIGMWFVLFTSPAFIFLIFSLLNLKTYISKLKNRSKK